jgi:hypothetical protein
MQKVEGSNPFSRSQENPAPAGFSALRGRGGITLGDVEGANIDRWGQPYVGAPVFVPVEHAFDARRFGEVHVDDVFGGFALDLDELDGLLEGECHRCGRAVDHRRGIPVVHERRLLIEIAVVPPVERTWQEPEHAREALELGWSVAPLCVDCHRVETRGRFDLVMERWREEGKIRRADRGPAS